MIRLVWRTDAHMADKGPVSRKDDWTETVLGKLDQVRRVAAKVKAQAVIDGGDFFHEKTPRNTKHATIKKIAALHNAYPCPVYCNVGNHDCLRGEISNLPKQPLGVLFETGVFKRCYDKHEALFEGDGLKVRVVGIPYHGTSYDLSRLDIQRGDEDWLMVSAHLLATPGGGSMFGVEDVIAYRDLVKYPVDLWAFGHSHADQGIQEITPGKFVINVGSLTRGSLHDDEIVRQPKVVVITFRQDKIEFLPINLAIADVDDVMDLEGAVRADNRAMVVDAYVDSIRKTLEDTIEKPLEEVVEDVVRTVKMPDQVKERALQILEEADG